jgi:hypothetical protein
MVRSEYSSTFLLFHRAILNRQQVTCFYKGRYREICPHILGHTDSEEAALVYQFGGDSAGGLTSRDKWRCFHLANVDKAELRTGRWYSGSSHRSTQLASIQFTSTSTQMCQTSPAGAASSFPIALTSQRAISSRAGPWARDLRRRRAGGRVVAARPAWHAAWALQP